VYFYSRDNEAEALQAKVLTKDEARRIAIVSRSARPLRRWLTSCTAMSRMFATGSRSRRRERQASDRIRIVAGLYSPASVNAAEVAT
jgi:hypothetical protein